MSAAPHPVLPFRFGVKIRDAPDARGWADRARRAESLGYDTLVLSDHVGYGFSPLLGALAAAQATTRLRVGTAVLCNDFRHPAILAREAATLDLLSEGRLELGLGAGWMREDYARTGIARDPARLRIERLEETLCVLRGLFAGEPFSFAGEHYQIDSMAGFPTPIQSGGPPILVGGGGRQLLSVAGRHADIVGINPTARSGVHDEATDLDADASRTDEKLAWLREAAGPRFDAIEIACEVYLGEVIDDPAEADRRVSERYRQPPSRARAVPNALVGSLAQIEETIESRRARWSMSYWIFPETAMEAFAPVVAALAGR